MIIRFQLLDGRPGRRIWRRAPYPSPQDGGGGRAGGERRGNAQRDRVEGERITSQIVRPRCGRGFFEMRNQVVSSGPLRNHSSNGTLQI